MFIGLFLANEDNSVEESTLKLTIYEIKFLTNKYIYNKLL